MLVGIALLTTVFALLMNALAERLAAPVSLVGSVLMLKLTHNPDIAYGIHLPLLPAFLAIALCGLVWLAWKEATTQLHRIAYGLILGGAIANIIDRAVDGVVTDYVFVSFFPYVFNAADSAITVGAVMLCVMAVSKRRRIEE